MTYDLAEVSAVSGDTVTAVGAEAQPDSRQGRRVGNVYVADHYNNRVVMLMAG
ncbi:hypothetical protein [Mycobacterium sp.]|uniref:hypothetical protein n=1 Tax=Mycobacterium sp. TaxID=1785 RepID=UPI003C728D66